MKILICLALIFVLAVSQSNLLQKQQKEKDFVDFANKYQKKYASDEEKAYRFSVYKDNLKKIAKLQEDNPEASFGVNQFSDLTEEEFLSIYANAKPEKKPVQQQYVEQNLATDIPSSLDLINSPVMSPVRDQGILGKKMSGSSFVFSASSVIEYSYWRKFNQYVTFSVQELIDCLPQSKNNSGSITQVFDYIQSQGGLSLDSDYPYTGVAGECKERKSLVPLNIQLASAPADVSQIKNALNTYGVLAIAVDASNWHSYKSGLFSKGNNSDSQSTNHYVNIVGYGQESGREYWKIRNSWGTWWGEKGYIRVPIYPSSGRKNSTTGLSQEIYYPVLSDNLL